LSQPYLSTRPSADMMAARTPPFGTTRPSVDTMAAYHARTPPHGERDPQRPSTTHFTQVPSFGQHGLQPNLMAACPAKGIPMKEDHPRRISWPNTEHRQPSEDPLVNSLLNT